MKLRQIADQAGADDALLVGSAERSFVIDFFGVELQGIQLETLGQGRDGAHVAETRERDRDLGSKVSSLARSGKLFGTFEIGGERVGAARIGEILNLPNSLLQMKPALHRILDAVVN